MWSFHKKKLIFLFLPFDWITTLESEINVWQGLENLSKRINVGPLINVGQEQNVQKLCYKKTSNLKISLGHGKNSKIY